MSDAAALVQRLRSGSRLAQLQALRSLVDLANSSSAARQQALVAGSVAAIVQLKGLSGGCAVQEAAGEALRALSQTPNGATLPAFVEAGAIHTVVSMLERSLDSGSATVQESTAATLWHLAGCGGGAAAVAACGAIPLLVQLLLAGRGQPISQADSAAAGAMFHFVEFKSDQLGQDIIEQGSVPALLALIERRKHAGAGKAAENRALWSAAATLGFLAEHNAECQAAVVAAGGVHSLASLLRSSCAEVQFSAADALRVLLHCSMAAQAAFAEAHAAPAAVRLLSSPSREAQRHAAGVLGNAAYSDPGNSAAILAAGAMQPLVQLLRTPDHPAQEWAALTVCNLCLMQPEAAAAAIQQAGGLLDALQTAACSEDEEVQEAVGKTMLAFGYALEVAAKQQAASGGSQPSASPADRAGAADAEAAGPADQPAARRARVCAAPRCGNTRGLKRCGG